MNYFKSVLSLLFLFLVVNSIAAKHSSKQIDMILGSMVNKPPKEIFKMFHQLHQKDYILNSEEGIRRYKIFKENLNWNKEKNEQLGQKVYGITQFMDMTDAEFNKAFLMDSVEMEKHIGRRDQKIFRNDFELKSNENDSINAIIQIDYTSLYSNNPSKDQKSCGSCWSFAANAAIEGQYKKNFGKDIDLSVQYLLDCDIVDNGCNG
jgi:C1A family cysteine protease